jgi:hypothetical protein
MKVELFDAALTWKLPAPLLAAVSTVIVPTGAEFLPTVKNQVERNASEAAVGVGLGDGTGVGEGEGDGDGIGVGVGVGCILLETEPHPARNSKSPVKRMKEKVRTKTSLDVRLIQEGELLIYRRAAAGAKLSGKTALTRRNKGDPEETRIVTRDNLDAVRPCFL